MCRNPTSVKTWKVQKKNQAYKLEQNWKGKLACSRCEAHGNLYKTLICLPYLSVLWDLSTYSLGFDV